MTKFNNWLMLKATPLLITIPVILFAPLLRAEATIVKGLRIGDNQGYVRLVLEMDRSLSPPPSVSIDRATMVISLTGILNDLSAPHAGENRGGIVSIDVSRVSDVMRIEALFSFVPADVKTFSLTGPHRFIIDAYRPIASVAVPPPIKKMERVSASEKIQMSPTPISEPGESVPPGGTVSEDSIKAHGSVSSTPSDDSELNRYRFQQQLIAALIAVTSIIVVLLLFLIWIGSDRNSPREPSWVKHLPPTKDPTIDDLDAAIREHLKSHDHR